MPFWSKKNEIRVHLDQTCVRPGETLSGTAVLHVETTGGFSIDGLTLALQGSECASFAQELQRPVFHDGAQEEGAPQKESTVRRKMKVCGTNLVYRRECSLFDRQTAFMPGDYAFPFRVSVPDASANLPGTFALVPKTRAAKRASASVEYAIVVRARVPGEFCAALTGRAAFAYAPQGPAGGSAPGRAATTVQVPSVLCFSRGEYVLCAETDATALTAGESLVVRAVGDGRGCTAKVRGIDARLEQRLVLRSHTGETFTHTEAVVSVSGDGAPAATAAERRIVLPVPAETPCSTDGTAARVVSCAYAAVVTVRPSYTRNTVEVEIPVAVRPRPESAAVPIPWEATAAEPVVDLDAQPETAPYAPSPRPFELPAAPPGLLVEDADAVPADAVDPAPVKLEPAAPPPATPLAKDEQTPVVGEQCTPAPSSVPEAAPAM